jgi:hypothetical protein
MPHSPTENTTATSIPESLISRLNDVLATRVTLFVGTMWAFYAFVIFGLTPLVWPEHEEQILYWSNFLQLVFLPVITVGTALMNRATEARAVSDHKKIRKEFKILKETHAELSGSLQQISRNVDELLKRNTSS